MVVLAKKEDRKEERENLVNTTTNSNVGSSDNDDDSFSDNIKDVTIGDFSKFVRIQDTLEKQIEKRSLRNQPGISFGEKLGMKIEEKVSDGFIDRMLGNMFTTGGTSSTKPDGWLAIVKVVLDSGFAQHAGANLHLSIESLGKAIGRQKTDQLADAVVQAVGPKKSAGSINAEDEQRKMGEYVLSLNPVNIVDIKKFMDLVNANPNNTKITDINQARNILIEEQDRIRRDNPVLAESMDKKQLEENPDIDRGQPMRQSPMGQRDNFMDSMMPRDMGTTGAGNSNQMTSEQILSLDPRDDASVTSYAWSQGHGQMLQEQNGLNKVRNILMRHQDDLMKQASGLGGHVEQPVIEQPVMKQPLTTEVVQGDFGWNEEDIGKKEVGRMDKKGEVLVPPHIADSPVTDNGGIKENQSSSPSETQMAQNSIMELLQKMANNFDVNMNEINQKLQAVENRIDKIENSTLPTQPAKIPIGVETSIEIPTEIIQNTINDLNLQDDQKIEDDVQDDQKIEDDVEEQKDVKSNISVISTKDETWWKNKKDDTESDSNLSLVITDFGTSTPKPVEELPKEDKEKQYINTQKKYEKGSMGWLKEQQKKKKLK